MWTTDAHPTTTPRDGIDGARIILAFIICACVFRGAMASLLPQVIRFSWALLKDASPIIDCIIWNQYQQHRNRGMTLTHRAGIHVNLVAS